MQSLLGLEGYSRLSGVEIKIQIQRYRRSLSVEVDEAGRALGARRVCWRVSLPSCLVEEVQRRLAGQSGPGGRRKKGKG